MLVMSTHPFFSYRTTEFECNETDIMTSHVMVNTSPPYFAGAIASFTCHDGYELDGESINECTLDGWNRSKPLCSKLSANLYQLRL